MPTVFSPSDYTTINADYSIGQGFYTDKGAISDLLQIPAFGAGTNPTQTQVGSIIKRVEGMIDDKVKRSYRPIRHEHEVHNFNFSRNPADSYYGGYVGFVQLQHMKVRKIVSLQVWQGSGYKELASASGSIQILDYAKLDTITLTLPDGSTTFTLTASNNVGSSLSDSNFNKKFGTKTTVREIVSLINEQYPAKTASFTGADNRKELTEDGATNFNVSDFFYASSDPDDGTKINISSLLEGEDGSDCVIAATVTSGSVADSITIDQFTDKQDMKRIGSFWKIGNEGRLFFLKDYPYHTENSVIVSYIAGDSRVPSAIHEAATKLAAAEILRHDDQTILIAETGANITTKEKYDILKKEAMEILDGKKDIVYIIE
ncbi:MAG: hypothetical protein GOVbin4206_92 [Prokaryotic dsDNA virus sp.]|nr:MAG: hypothetical protein GOVbin4206_92 [Prokaryotic dsDNA virus sp.]